MEDISSRIKKLREDKNMSMGAFAASIGCSKAYISYIEANRRPVTDSIAAKIINAHSLNKDWFIFGRGDMYDRHRTARKEAFFDSIQTLKLFLRTSGYFRRLLSHLDFHCMTSSANCSATVFDLCHNLNIDFFYHSEISPGQLFSSIFLFYQETELLLSRCIRFIHLIKEDPPLGFGDFYSDNENEKLLIDRIKAELLSCRKLYTDFLHILRKNTDDNDLLDISGYYMRLYKTLSYKQNIEIIQLMQKKNICRKV